MSTGSPYRQPSFSTLLNSDSPPLLDRPHRHVPLDIASLCSPSPSAYSSVSPASTDSTSLRIQPPLQPQPSSYPTVFDRPPAGRVPIPANSPSSPSSFTELATPARPTGSIVSRDYSQIPPRPKPGRKPATDSPSSKRKEQNREAQRAYRARKAQQCDELEEELSRRTKEWTEKEATWQRKLDDLEKAQIQADANHRAYSASLERQISDERARSSRFEEEIHRLNRELGAARAHRFSDSSITSYPSRGSGTTWSQPITPPTQDPTTKRPGQLSRRLSHDARRLSQKTFNPDCRKCEDGGPCVCLQQGLQRANLSEFEPQEAMEIDFTTTHSKKRDSATAGLTDRPDASGAASCGFCTDKDNCVCAMDATTAPIVPPPQPQSSKSQGPGSCDRCMQDPERARWCRMLAQEVPTSAHDRSGTAISSPRDPPSPPSPRQTNHLPSIDEKASMTCDEAYDQFTKNSGLNQRRDSLTFIRQLKARPAQESNASAFEVDMASVLTAMKGAGRNAKDVEGRP